MCELCNPRFYRWLLQLARSNKSRHKFYYMYYTVKWRVIKKHCSCLSWSLTTFLPSTLRSLAMKYVASNEKKTTSSKNNIKKINFKKK